MSTITTEKQLNLKNIADGVTQWLEFKSWQTKVEKVEGNYYVRARKSSWWRAAIGADRALVIHIYSNEEGTSVAVGQGDWTTNIWSNVFWFVATGGTNIAISGWSFVLQKQLQQYVKEMLDGAHPGSPHSHVDTSKKRLPRGHPG